MAAMWLFWLAARLRHWVGLVATVFTAITATGPSAGPTLSPNALANHLARLASLTREVVDSYIDRSGPGDPRYWQNGSFVAVGPESCWYCYDTAATAAAVLSREDGGDARMRNIAVETFDHAIRTYQQPDGAFTDGIATGFFAVELGVSYLELRSYLDPDTRATWVASIRRAANYLLLSGDMTYYINGNVDLRQTEVMWLAWAVTHQQRFLNAYNSSWTFTVTPPQQRWPGFGLQITAVPTLPDASDGAGYLAESGGGTPGFDPSYTMVQLDTATELYVLTRDPRYLRLMNLLFNQERPRIGGDDVLNATGGTRENDMTPFMSAGPAVLVLSADRPNLTGFWLAQLGTIHVQYRAAMKYSEINFYKGTSGWLSVPVLAIEWPHGMLGAPCVPRQSVVCAQLF